MSPFSQRIPDIPGSRYASELKRNPRGMRFPPDLEHEYHRFYLAERHAHVRTFNLIMCALVGLAILVSLLRGGFAEGFGEPIRIAIIELAYLATLWAAYSQRFERIYLPTATFAAIAIACCGAIEVAFRVRHGDGELFGLLTAYSIGLYFLAGILYKGALQANLVMVVTFCATLLALGGVSMSKVVYLTATLAITATITGVAFRHQGVRFRRQFLEKALIAEMAARDGLTGLKNRRAFDEHLSRLWQQALRDRRAFALMLIDVDHFKKFNDRYGHQAGDEALQRIAATVDGFAKRPLDLAARYGGEELAVLLFDLQPEASRQTAELLRAAVEALNIEHVDSRMGRITVSIGVALIHPTLERSPDGAVQLADEALYAAKREGRNRLMLFEREHETLSTGTFKTR